MSDDDLEELARETAATKTALIRARDLSLERDIDRLLKVGEGMGVYTNLRFDEDRPARARREPRVEAS